MRFLNQQLQNQNHKRIQNRITRYCFIVFSVSFLCLCLAKVNFVQKTKRDVASLPSGKTIKTVSLDPVVLNLKNKQGSQLSKIQVNIETYENSVQKELLSEKDKFLKKHLLLTFSGQEEKQIKKNKNIFEKQLVSQINAFLSSGQIENINIQFVN